MLASMTPPIKKRQIEMENNNDGDSYSEPSFDSPASDEDYDDEDYQAQAFDMDEDDDQTVVGKSFQVPTLESQESVWNSPGLGTQPTPRSVRTRTPIRQQHQQNRPAKKRKVSLSPTDSLAFRRTTQRTESPKKVQLKSESHQNKNTQISQNTVDTLIVDLDGNDEVDLNIGTKSAVPATNLPEATEGTNLTCNLSPPTEQKEFAFCARTPAAAKKSDVVASAHVLATSEKTTPSESPNLGKKTAIAKKKLAARKSQQKMNEKGEDEAIVTTRIPGIECVEKRSTKAGRKATENLTKPHSTVRKNHNQPWEGGAPAKVSVEAQIPDANLITKTTSEVRKIVSPMKPLATNSASVGKPPSSTSSAPLPSTKVTTSKKKKKKKRKRSFQDDLLDLLFMSCKPYTIKALAQQLKTNEASINFCMLSLVDKGWVIKKEFTSKSGNRSKELYWANQESKSKELMDSLQMVPPNEIKQARDELADLQKEHTSVTQDLATVLGEPSNVELNKQFQTLEEEVQKLENDLRASHSRIRAAQQGGQKSNRSLGATRGIKGTSKKLVVKPVVSSKRLKKRINNMRLHWKKRKEKCVDFIEQLADGMEKKVKEVIKLLELETDEMMGVKIPPKHDDV